MKYDKEKFVAWLNAKWVGEKACPVCRNNNWALGDDVIEVRPYQGGGLVVGGPVYPQVPIICGVCGHTLLFNAVVSNAITPKGTEAEYTAEASAGDTKSRKEGQQ